MPAESAQIPHPTALADALASYHRAPTHLGFHDVLNRFVAACRQIARAHASGRLHPGLTPRLIQTGEYADTAVIGWERTPSSETATALPAEDDALPYRAPEQIVDVQVPRLSAASDVYSLGAVLYECLTGRPPYEGASRERLLARIREGLPWPPTTVAPKVPPPLEAVCLQAMDPDPRHRYAGAADLARDVERWLAGEPVLAVGAPRKTGLLARLLRSRLTLAALLVLLAVDTAALSGCVYLLRQQQREVERVGQANLHLQEQHHEATAALQRAATETVLARLRQQALAGEGHQQALAALRALALLAQPRPDDAPAAAESKRNALAAGLAAARQVARLTDDLGSSERAAILDRLYLGQLFLMLGQGEEGRGQYNAGLALARALAQAHPRNPQALQDLMYAARGLGQANTFLGQLAPARDAYREALTPALTLVAATPASPDARRDVAVGYQLIADAGVRLGDLAGARAEYKKMLAVVEGHVSEPADPAAARLALAAYASLGDLERRDRRPDEARAWYEQALKALEKGQPQAAQRQALESALEMTRSLTRAVEDLDYALAQPPDVAQGLLVGRAAILARRGRLADAAATAEKLRTLKPDDGSNLYNVACCLALCAAAEDTSAYAGRALDALRDAVARGWRDAAHTEADADWTALRGDARFRALLDEMRRRQAWLTFPILP